MQTLIADEIINAWVGQDNAISAELEDMLDLEIELTTGFLQILSAGQPVSAAHLAERVGLPVEQIEAIFEQFAARGGEFDAQGNLVGAALTINPTLHRFRVKGNDLYAWCALDTFFLPNLIGETAMIESIDPISGEPIRLTITPDGVAEVHPASTVLSITIPGVSCRTETSSGPDTGPHSEACSQMYFFTSPETAEIWLEDRPGIAIFTVEEAWRLAKAHWIDKKCCVSSSNSQNPG